MDTTYVAQISDLHLFADTHTRMMGIHTWETFSAVMSLMKNSQYPVDHIIFSGDIAQDLQPKTYELFAKVVRKYSYPCYWIPGNHDDLPVMQRIFTHPPFVDHKLIDAPHWRIILLNSHLPGKTEGHISDSELTWLEQSCQEAQQDHIALCVHHHLHPVGCQWLDPLAVNNANDVLNLIGKYEKIRLVFNGHVHQAHETIIDAVHYLSAPSTCFQFKPCSDNFAIDRIPPGYRWLALHANGSITSEVRRCRYVPAGLDVQCDGY